VHSPINGRISSWYDELPAYRPALPGDRDADVCIVGAGYTGLWTAYYLKVADPSLRIAVLEARFAGFGASGRNGGWLSGLVPGDRDRMAQQHGRDGVVAWQRALNDAVDEVIDVAAREGIEAGIVKGGTLQIARNAAQAARLTAEAEEELSWKVDGIAVLSKAEAAERIRFDHVLAAYHNPHCARIQPAQLARGLADTVASLGVDIYERSPVTAIDPGKATTPHGAVTAPIVLRATEGFTARLPGLRRRWLPMNSLPDRRAARGAAPGPRRPDRARLVWCARGAAGLVGRCRTRQGHRNGLGRWICRPRRHGDEPRGPDLGRSRPRPQDAVDRAAMGRPPVAELGARAAALARCAQHVSGLQGLA
jgi:glycine/D-amino acid oxidase-like deaminating enzyme